MGAKPCPRGMEILPVRFAFLRGRFDVAGEADGVGFGLFCWLGFRGAESGLSQRLFDAGVVTGSARLEALDDVGGQSEADGDLGRFFLRAAAADRLGGEFRLIVGRGQVWSVVRISPIWG